MRITTLLLMTAFFGAALSGCDFKKEADAQFGDQHFKTAIALVELHKVRYGTYPDTLESLTHKGDWDAIALHSVEYSRVGSGYQLNLIRGWMGAPQLTYPADFWRGLGIVSSNVGGAPAMAPDKAS